MNPCAVLILAAGLSRRMGKFKPLLKLGGKTFIERLTSLFFDCNVDVYVVVGYRGQELRMVLENRSDVTFVENPEYSRGMFTSVQAGVCSLGPRYEAFFVMPADMPVISKSSIKALLAAHDEHPDKIIYPLFHGRRGHPPLVPMSLAPVIARWPLEGNLKEALSSCEPLSVEINLPDKNILVDIDTPADYDSLLKARAKKS